MNENQDYQTCPECFNKPLKKEGCFECYGFGYVERLQDESSDAEETVEDFEADLLSSDTATNEEESHEPAESSHENLTNHELADLFPLLEETELEALAEDIRTNGQIQPITLFEGKILDGRNRYLACKRLGVKPLFSVIPKSAFPDADSVAAFVISVNIRRRHLSTAERCDLALRLLPKLETAAQERWGQMTPSLSSPLGRSTEIAAKLVGVSASTIKRAKHAVTHPNELMEEKAALSAADPEQVEARTILERAKAEYKLMKKRGQELEILGKEILEQVKNDPGFSREISEYDMEVAINRIVSLIDRAKPHAQCSYCQYDKKDRDLCLACKKAGWVTKRMHDGTPADLRIELAKILGRST